MEWLGESEIMKDLDSLSHMTRETPLNKIRNWTLEEPKPIFETGYEDDGDMDMDNGNGPSWSKPFTGSGRGALHLKTYEQINSQAQRDRDIQAQVRLATSHNYSNETIEQTFRVATPETDCKPGTVESPLPGQFDDVTAEAWSVEASSTVPPPAVSSPAVSSPAVSSPAKQARVGGREERKRKVLSLQTILKMNSIVTNAVTANEKGRKVNQAVFEDCEDDKLSAKPNGSWCKPLAAEKVSAEENSRNLSKTEPSVKTPLSLNTTALLTTASMKTPPLKTAPSMKTTPPEHHTAQDHRFLDSLKPAPPVYELKDRNQFPGLGGASRRK